ncbi:MAG TPA: glycosyltransferase family 39 protein [Bacteroidota bacterium]|nr:glycosyltransferase family 39 protein [Bacteroidota bacterium]
MIRTFIREHPLIFIFALIKLALHLVANAMGGYDYFRDEFYYIACSERLDWGYVDHPPLSIFILWLNRLLLGDSLFALRLLPALAGAGTVVLTGLLVNELGGGRRAQVLALLAVVIAPVFLILSDFYSMNAFEPLFWTGAAYLLVRIINTGDHRLWLWFGTLAGLGLQNKHSMAFFGIAIVVGLLLTSEHKQLANKWIWLGGIIAGVLFLPNIIWQMMHGWPTLEFAKNAQQGKNLPMSPLEFFGAQLLFHHPVAFPLWIGGLGAFFFHPRLKSYRVFGYAFAFLFILFVIQRGKPYYLSPFFPLLVAAGAITLDEFFVRKQWVWAFRGYASVLAIGGLITMPLVLPLLPVETYIRYAAPFGIAKVKTERHADTELPQTFADRFGWREMAQAVAKVLNTLPSEERAKTVIYGQNYGEAGAVEFFGSAYNLPAVFSGHNSYWWWGPPADSMTTVIIIGGRRADHERVFASVEHVATHSHPLAMRYESDLPIFLCREPKMPISEIWSMTRHYN